MDRKENSHTCNVCGKFFGRQDNLRRHEKSHEKSNDSHICSICGQSFGRKDTLTRHEKSHKKAHTCNICGKSFGRQDHLTRHEKIHIKQPSQKADKDDTSNADKDDKSTEASAEKPMKADKDDKSKEPAAKKPRVEVHFECRICGASFENVQELTEHVQSHPFNREEEDIEEGAPLIEQALNGSLKVVTFHTKGQQKLNLTQFFSDVKHDISQYIQNESAGINGVKWYMVCGIKFVKFEENGNTVEKVDTVGFLHSRATIKLPGEDEDLLDKFINEAFFRLFNNCENFKDLHGTGWVIDEILHLKLMMGKYRPLGGETK